MRNKLLKQSKLEQLSVPATGLQPGDMLFGHGPAFTVVHTHPEVDEVAVVGKGVALRLDPSQRVDITRRVFASKTAASDEEERAFANQFPDENAYVKHHNTGYIAPEVYNKFNLDWQKPEKYPKLLKRVTLNDGRTQVDFRQEGTKNHYVKHNTEGEIVRDSQGLALYMSDEEMTQAGLPMYDTTIMAFNDQGQCVGQASDEFGADGIWVRPEYQGKGLGTLLLTEFRRQFKKVRQMGQMTPAGQQLTKNYYRSLTGKEPQPVEDYEENPDYIARRAIWRFYGNLEWVSWEKFTPEQSAKLKEFETTFEERQTDVHEILAALQAWVKSQPAGTFSPNAENALMGKTASKYSNRLLHPKQAWTVGKVGDAVSLIWFYTTLTGLQLSDECEWHKWQLAEYESINGRIPRNIRAELYRGLVVVFPEKKAGIIYSYAQGYTHSDMGMGLPNDLWLCFKNQFPGYVFEEREGIEDAITTGDKALFEDAGVEFKAKPKKKYVNAFLQKDAAEYLTLAVQNGKPIVFYHGTDAKFDTFETKPGLRGDGGIFEEKVHSPFKFFTRNFSYAADVADHKGRGNILHVYLKMENPLDLATSDGLVAMHRIFGVFKGDETVDGLHATMEELQQELKDVEEWTPTARVWFVKRDAEGNAVAESSREGNGYVREEVSLEQAQQEKVEQLADTKAEIAALQRKINHAVSLKEQPPCIWDYLDQPDSADKLKAAGYDSIIFRENEGSESYAVIDPTQIKEVRNKGTFDPSDPSIMASKKAARKWYL